MRNQLAVDRQEFVEALKTLRRAEGNAEALLAFEDDYLSIELGDRAVVMHARGEWHGRARFSGNMLRALAQLPPREDPVMIQLQDGRLRISTMVIGCRWETVSARFIGQATNPGYLDLLAMDRTLSRAEIHGSGLARKIGRAKSTISGRVSKAAKLLEVAGITESEIWAIVERNICARMQGESVAAESAPRLFLSAPQYRESFPTKPTMRRLPLPISASVISAPIPCGSALTCQPLDLLPEVSTRRRTSSLLDSHRI